MPNIDPRCGSGGVASEASRTQLRGLADDLAAIAPFAAGIESRLEALPFDVYDIATDLQSFYAILDVGRRLLARRTAEVLEGLEMTGWSERVTVTELAAGGLPEGAVGVAWTSFEECSRHASAHAPGRAGVQPAGRGVILYGSETVDCSDCGPSHKTS